MSDPRARLFRGEYLRYIVALGLCVAALSSAACAGDERQIQQHQKAILSVRASVTAIGQAWLAGAVSDTYTAATLERMFSLVEQERASLAKPHLLIDARATRLAESADELARGIAHVISDLRGADTAAARHDLGALPLGREQP